MSTPIYLSNRAQYLHGQPMFQILAQVRELERRGKSILHFELGDPDFDTPTNIVRAGIKAIKNGLTHYAPSSGLLELKLAAQKATLKSRGFMPTLNQLLVTAGANVAIYYALACTCNPGDEVIVPNPGFVSYFSIAKWLGLEVVDVPLFEHRNFRLCPSDVESRISPKTKVIIINSPSNPTGAVMIPDEVARIYEIANSCNALLISDEVYARMIYNQSFYSPSTIDACKERVILVNGFSKSYAMTGWRLGVVTGPEHIIEKMSLLLETTSSCVNPFVQMAGVEALKGDQRQTFKMVAEYKKRRDMIVCKLNGLHGVSCITPQGAFYVFPNISKTGATSAQYADWALTRGVAVVPGTVFGAHGEGYVRLCYACNMDKIKEGIRRLKR